MNRIGKGSLKQRLAALYLIDSVCQASHLRVTESSIPPQSDPYLSLTLSAIPQLVSLVCPRQAPEGSPLSSGHLDGVNKVLSLWVSRKMFPESVVQQAAAQVGIVLDLSGAVQSMGFRGAKRSNTDVGAASSQNPERPIKRRPSSSPSSTPPKELARDSVSTKAVFVWSLDDCVLKLDALQNGSFAVSAGKDVGDGMQLRERMEQTVLSFADQHMFFGDVEHIDGCHIDDVADFDNGIDLRKYNFDDEIGTSLDSPDCRRKLAYRYRIIKNLYQKVPLSHLLPSEEYQQLQGLLSDMDRFTDSWLTSIQRVLGILKDDPCTKHVFVSTSTRLVLALAKCKLYNLSSLVSVENVYACSKEPLDKCLEEILRRHGRAVYYYLAANTAGAEPACQKLGIPLLVVKTPLDVGNMETHLNGIREWRSRA
eukprot:c11857_g1_i2.p1 GENE.c11857_g1_i2~~c11857_g1_i2.p1  ORF type:complete len:424 (+),score=82.78 c11857_g1_i2:223-1494(+)